MTGVLSAAASGHLRRLATLPGLVDGSGSGLEAAPADEAWDAAEVTGRLEDRLTTMFDQRPPEEGGDLWEFRRAVDILLSQTEKAVTKPPDAPLTIAEANALEAVIR